MELKVPVKEPKQTMKLHRSQVKSAATRALGGKFN